MELPISLGTKSNEIGSIHYSGGSIPWMSILEGAPYANANTEAYPMSFAFKNHSSTENWNNLVSYSLTAHPFQDNGYVITSSSKKFVVPVIDLAMGDTISNPEFLYNPGDSSDRMAGWLNAAVGPRAIKYVNPNNEIGLSRSLEFLPDYSKFGMTNVNIHVSKLEGEVPINLVGQYVSRIHDTWADLRNVLFKNYFIEMPGYSDEAIALKELFDERGLGPAREIEGIGVMNYKKGTKAATLVKDGTVIFYSSKNIYNEALAMAAAQGLRGEKAVAYAKQAIWYHEFNHAANRNRIISIDGEEIRIGEDGAEHFGRLEALADEGTAKYYKAMKNFNEAYAKSYRRGRVSQRKSSLLAKLSYLTAAYKSEAEEQGLSSEEVANYVKNKLEEHVRGAEESDLEAVIEEEFDGEGNEISDDVEYMGSKSSDDYSTESDVETDAEMNDDCSDEAGTSESDGGAESEAA